MTTNSKLLVNKDETPSEFLYRIRRERDYTQKQIAKFMGVSQVTVMRWESGQSAISSKSAKGLGEFFNIDPSNFYSSEDPVAGSLPLSDMLENFRICDEKRGCNMPSQNLKQMLPLTKDTFGVLVQTDSMESDFPNRTIPKGAVAVIRPVDDLAKCANHVVYGTFDDKTFVIKELCMDGNRYILKPWNRQYPTVTELSCFKVRGFVIGYFMPV